MIRRLLFSFLIIFIFPLFAQGLNTSDPFSYVGMTLAELIDQFGVPASVAIARGNEIWQDDVVFHYTAGEFYIYRDRVWQVKLASANGVSNRDRKAAVIQTLGENAEDKGDHVLLPISGRNWPLMLRVNFNSSSLVSEIFIYRPDY